MNILIITPYYPVLNNPKLNVQPKVVHYFAKSWVEKGHNVLVVHTYPHKLADTINFPKVLASFSLKTANLQLIDGVKVTMIEWYRWWPGSFQLTRIQQENTISYIFDAVRKWGVKPDRIICHFPGACMWLMKLLKDNIGCPQIAMFHNIDLSLVNSKDSSFSEECHQIYSSIGFRSVNIKKQFESLVRVNLPNFVATSGVPEDVLQSVPKKHLSKISTLRLTFVGRLDKNKNVETILYALSKLQDKIDYQFTVIGDGARERFLKKLTYRLAIEDKVRFLGRQDRQTVFEELKKTDVFVMVSHRETLGLAYLEAMACGCIVIGSSGTGIDGIVKNRENGFLVKSDDYNQLSKIIDAIYHMDLNDLNHISFNSFNTIHKYTDKKMANLYLKNVLNIVSVNGVNK